MPKVLTGDEVEVAAKQVTDWKRTAPAVDAVGYVGAEKTTRRIFAVIRYKVGCEVRYGGSTTAGGSIVRLTPPIAERVFHAAEATQHGTTH